MGFITNLLTVLKAKEIDTKGLTAEDLAKLEADIIPPLPTANQKPIEIPEDLKHNARYIEQFDARFKEMESNYKKLVEGQTAQIEELKKLLGAEVDAREKGLKAMEEAAAKERAAKIESILDEAKKAGKIAPKDEDTLSAFKGLLEKDFDTAQKAIAALKPAISNPTEKITTEGKAGGVARSPLATAVNPTIMKELEENSGINLSELS